MLAPFLAPIAVPVAGKAAAKLDDVPPAPPPAATLTFRRPAPSTSSGCISVPSDAPIAVPVPGLAAPKVDDVPEPTARFGSDSLWQNQPSRAAQKSVGRSGARCPARLSCLRRCSMTLLPAAVQQRLIGPLPMTAFRPGDIDVWPIFFTGLARISMFRHPATLRSLMARTVAASASCDIKDAHFFSLSEMGSMPVYSKCIGSFLPFQSPPHDNPWRAAISETFPGKSVLILPDPKGLLIGLTSTAFPYACWDRLEPPRFMR
jgi:hypothetical protein